MKKKVLTFALLGLLTVGFMVPIVAHASESWDYGFNQSRMQWYNNYYHSSSKHFGSITKLGVTYYGPVANGGGWSKLNLDFNGPYNVTYNKHTL